MSPHGMNWDKAKKTRPASRVRTDYDAHGPVRADQKRKLNNLAHDTTTVLPSFAFMDQEQADELIGYLQDVKKGIRR